MRNEKGFSHIVLVIVLLAIFLLLAVYVQIAQSDDNLNIPQRPKSDSEIQNVQEVTDTENTHEVAGTKTVVLDNLMVSFDIPSSWYTLPSELDKFELVINDGQIASNSLILGPEGTIRNLENSDQEAIGSTKSIVKSYVGYNGILNQKCYIQNNCADETEVSYTEYHIGERIAVIAEYRNTHYIKQVYVPLESDYGILFTIENESNEKILDLILSTFRFIEK